MRAAREANAGMPAYTVGLLEGAYGDLTGARVVVLGAAYRGGVKETAFSGVFDAVEALRARGRHALVHDPMYTDEELQQAGLRAVPPGRAGRTRPWCRPTTRSTATLAAEDLPGVRVSSTAAG